MAGNQKATDDAQSGTSEAAPGESALDSLLSEFEQQNRTTEKPKTSTADVVGALRPVVDFANQEMTRRNAEDARKDMDSVVGFITEPDELKGLNEDLAIGLLEAYARKSPEFAQAYQNRQKNASAWTAALEKGRDWVKDTVGKMGTNSVRTDIEAASAAIHGSTTRASKSEGPSPTEMAAMGDVEFENLKAKLRVGAPG